MNCNVIFVESGIIRYLCSYNKLKKNNNIKDNNIWN